MRRYASILILAAGLAVGGLPSAAGAPVLEAAQPAAPAVGAPSAATSPRISTIVVRRSQSAPWPVTSVTRQPRLIGSTPARRAAVASWATTVVASHTAEIRRENRSRVAEPGPCPESPRASITSQSRGGVLAGRWVSVGLSFTSYPGCAGTATWTRQATATWNLSTGVRARLGTFVSQPWPLEQLVNYQLDYPCSADPESITKAPLSRWTLSRAGLVFWLDKYEWGRMGGCGSQQVLIPWSGLKLTAAGQRIAAFYGYRGGTGIPNECWPSATCH